MLQVWDSKEDYKERANEEWALTLMYVFFANGEIPEKYSLPNSWHKTVIDGTGYLLKNQFREASECFKKALMCQPTDAFLYPSRLLSFSLWRSSIALLEL